MKGFYRSARVRQVVLGEFAVRRKQAEGVQTRKSIELFPLIREQTAREVEAWFDELTLRQAREETALGPLADWWQSKLWTMHSGVPRIAQPRR